MAASESIGVFVCDDSHPLRRLVALQLGEDEHFRVVGEASEARECLERVARSAPDVLLLDHGLEPEQGFEAFLETLRLAAPRTRIVLFSGLPAHVLAREADERGLDGFLEKGQPAAELRRGILALARRSAAGA
jgi:DNA-binding NarL/FixJ family response regulator